MVRPHGVNFMDQMLHSDENLRVEGITVPAHVPATALEHLVPKSREYLLMAAHEHGKWVFNPPGSQLVKAGATLALMASPDGRAHLEKFLKG